MADHPRAMILDESFVYYDRSSIPEVSFRDFTFMTGVGGGVESGGSMKKFMIFLRVAFEKLLNAIGRGSKKNVAITRKVVCQ